MLLSRVYFVHWKHPTFGPYNQSMANYRSTICCQAKPGNVTKGVEKRRYPTRKVQRIAMTPRPSPFWIRCYWRLWRDRLFAGTSPRAKLLFRNPLQVEDTSASVHHPTNPWMLQHSYRRCWKQMGPFIIIHIDDVPCRATLASYHRRTLSKMNEHAVNVPGTKR